MTLSFSDIRDAQQRSRVAYTKYRESWQEYETAQQAYIGQLDSLLAELEGSTLPLNTGPLLVCGHYAQPKERMRTGNELWCDIHCNWQEKV